MNKYLKAFLYWLAGLCVIGSVTLFVWLARFEWFRFSVFGLLVAAAAACIGLIIYSILEEG